MADGGKVWGQGAPSSAAAAAASTDKPRSGATRNITGEKRKSPIPPTLKKGARHLRAAHPPSPPPLPDALRYPAPPSAPTHPPHRRRMDYCPPFYHPLPNTALAETNRKPPPGAGGGMSRITLRCNGEFRLGVGEIPARETGPFLPIVTGRYATIPRSNGATAPGRAEIGRAPGEGSTAERRGLYRSGGGYYLPNKFPNISEGRAGRVRRGGGRRGFRGRIFGNRRRRNRRGRHRARR